MSLNWQVYLSVQFSSVTQSCPTLCDPMNRTTPGLPVHHQLPEFTQTHVHPVSDAIQPSHPLSSPSPLAPNPSQHQSLFQWVNSSPEVAKVPGLKFRPLIHFEFIFVYGVREYSKFILLHVDELGRFKTPKVQAYQQKHRFKWWGWDLSICSSENSSGDCNAQPGWRLLPSFVTTDSVMKTRCEVIQEEHSSGKNVAPGRPRTRLS